VSSPSSGGSTSANSRSWWTDKWWSGHDHGTDTATASPKIYARRDGLAQVDVVAGGVLAVTSWAPLRNRFVQGDVNLSVAGININSEGRTKVWAVVWSGAQNELLIGHGPGRASALSVSVDPAFDHPHSDYLLVVYDFGVVGLVLLAWFSIRSARLLRQARDRSRVLVPAVAALNGRFGFERGPALWGAFRATRRSLTGEQVQSSEGAALECVRINTLTPEWIWYHA
jgi:hypothetical protein